MSQAPESDAIAWYRLSPEATCDRLGVDPLRGLDEAEITKRLKRYGPNRLAEEPPEPG